MARKTDVVARGEAYVDTSAFIAFLDRSDTYHSLFARLFSRPPQLFTTALVVGEGHAWFLRRYDETRAMQFLLFVEELSEVLSIVDVGAGEVEGARKVLLKYGDQKLTIADAVGLHLMKKRRIKSCWSTDRHLNLNGVPLVIHEL